MGGRRWLRRRESPPPTPQNTGEVIGSPVTAEVIGSPVTAEVIGSPVTGEVIPVTGEVIGSPVTGEVIGSPVTGRMAACLATVTSSVSGREQGARERPNLAVLYWCDRF